MPQHRTFALILVTAVIVLLLLPRGDSSPSYRVLASTTAQQGVPPGEIRYQAYLTDGGGVPINSPSLGFVFTIYDDPILGSTLHSESQSLAVIGGVVSENIGPLPDAVFQSNFDLWVGVTVGGDSEMVPRLRVLSVPFAIRAKSAITAENVPGADITPNSVTVTDTLDLQGAVISNASSANSLRAATTRAVSAGANPIGNVLRSEECGDFATSATTDTPVTNLSGSLDTSGRPVFVMLQPASTVTGTFVQLRDNETGDLIVNADIMFYRNGSRVSAARIGWEFPELNFEATKAMTWPPAAFMHIDTPPAGTNTYECRVRCNQAGRILRLKYVQLVAYEL